MRARQESERLCALGCVCGACCAHGSSRSLLIAPVDVEYISVKSVPSPCSDPNRMAASS